ncbi:IMPACT family protein [Biostraticola tofi]|uniref:Putative YigZ family protein n=1 Tax=Biostraticola tofi TaxID=466109 RepID=A0A4R3YRQ1_9GAMM|nr:IMPACT family protein [Biostraticola tofi]TCV95655.1 putative YigZ family protein [Biostraticola tofi]
MNQAYAVPAAPIMLSAEIKKSRFITLLEPACGTVAAKAFIARIRAEHPSAAHHCWAYIAGPADDQQQWGFSDDGEPSGTAGRPMLAQLAGSGLGEITAVVVRYYGGVRLGTGGLVKAYGGGVQQALKRVVRQQKIPYSRFILSCSYGQVAWVEAVVRQVDGRILQGDYQESIILSVELPAARLDEANEKLRDLSHGALLFSADSQ